MRSRTSKIISLIAKMLWRADPLSYLGSLQKKYSGKPESKLLKYVKNVWSKFIRNNMLNYSNINQTFRANSIVEAYNGRIKKLLPYKPSVAQFINFIRNEENYFTKEIFRKILQGEQQRQKQYFRESFQSILKSEDNSETESIFGDDRIPTSELSEEEVEYYSDEVTFDNDSKQNSSNCQIFKKTSPSLKRKLNQISPATDPKEDQITTNYKKKLCVQNETQAIEWSLENKMNSCRYTTFLTLYNFKLIDLDPAFNKESKLRNSGPLNKLIQINATFSQNKHHSI